MFANLEDEDVCDGKPRPPGKHISQATAAAFQILKIDFALCQLFEQCRDCADTAVVRDFVDAINNDFPNALYSDVMVLDARFRQTHTSLPGYLRYDIARPFDPLSTTSKRYLHEQRLFMGITLHNRLLRLHRAYMARGYADPTYAHSTKTCLESAGLILDLVSQSRAILCRWWVVLVHVWTSGLVLAVDLVRIEHDEEKREVRVKGLKLALGLMQ